MITIIKIVFEGGCMKSIITVFLMLVSLFSASAYSMDANLEQCINEQVKSSRVAVASITEISCSSLNIESIEGIEVLESLMAIDLTNNLISDFSPLVNLKSKNLRVAYLSDNRLPCSDLVKTIEQLNGMITLGLDRHSCVGEKTEPKKPNPVPTPTPKPPREPGKKTPPTPPKKPTPPSIPKRPTPPKPPLPPGKLPKPGRQGEGSNKGLTGVEVYKKECAICHGETGEGTDRGYPLRFVKSRFFQYVTREGRKLPPEFDIDMPAYDEEIVSHLQMTEMVEFLHSFEKPQTGKDLYFYYCENCHGPRGIGGVSREKIYGEDSEEMEEAVREGHHRGEMWDRRVYASLELL